MIGPANPLLKEEEEMFILAHADHPELFFMGLITGVVLVLAHVAYRAVRKSK